MIAATSAATIAAMNLAEQHPDIRSIQARPSPLGGTHGER